MFPAPPREAAPFDWASVPAVLGLQTEVPDASFDGAPCSAAENACASCAVPAYWPATWIGSCAQPHDEPAMLWRPDWPVEASLPAAADDAAPFD